MIWDIYSDVGFGIKWHQKSRKLFLDVTVLITARVSMGCYCPSNCVIFVHFTWPNIWNLHYVSNYLFFFQQLNVCVCVCDTLVKTGWVLPVWAELLMASFSGSTLTPWRKWDTLRPLSQNGNLQNKINKCHKSTELKQYTVNVTLPE